MDKHPIGDMMSTTLGKIREMIDADMIIGKSITTADGIMIIPVSKLSFGFASGGSDFQSKQPNQPNPFGGGGGAGVKLDPVAFIVVKDGNVKILNITPPPATTVDRLIDSAPEMIDKVTGLMKKEKPAEE